ncbi:MAG: hypothetical protein E6I29_09230 [Chloroflexi bacterium]|nr:MAG: hypothetical protein E6I29_09230 [Chloroflexota bacterium]
MIIFWIFTLFVGASAFAFADIALQLGVAWSLVYAVIAMLVCRGVLTLFKRWLILSERIAPENVLRVLRPRSAGSPGRVA